ncbi:MAG: isoprenylcysteine carboxylmethyltransferase family protein [Proteobacteria bacterium]|nr:isoprenylcysteine carboxylmethyltransferase family protein [Pseudomonadota bacterium]
MSWGLSQIVPMGLVSGVALVEIYASRRRRAGAQTRDRGSLLMILPLIGAGYAVGFGLWDAGPPPPYLGLWALWAGAAVAVAGMALRLWSVATLGKYFTYVVKVSPDQAVVEHGPYRRIRHPSYTGGLMTAVGIGLSLRYAWAPLLIGLPNLAGYLIRIFVEEAALAQGLGAPYRDYMRRTKRLIPYVW